MRTGSRTTRSRAGHSIVSMKCQVMLQTEMPITTDSWIEIRDGDPRLRTLYNRHYSAYQYRDGRQPKKMAGPGQYMALITPEADAIFVWRKFIDASGNKGINCAVFRNEGPRLSSYLIREAMARARSRWPGERLYTYINPRKIRSVNPGCCFKKCGWREAGRTKKRNLIVLEFEA
jgi:hypothetical protein